MKSRKQTIDLNRTRLKDLPAWLRESLDCDAQLKIVLDTLQHFKKALEMSCEKDRAAASQSSTTYWLKQEIELCDRYILLTQDNIKLNSNMEITYAERLKIVKEYGLAEIQILEELVTRKKSLNQYVCMIQGMLEARLAKDSEIPPEE